MIVGPEAPLFYFGFIVNQPYIGVMIVSVFGLFGCKSEAW